MDIRVFISGTSPGSCCFVFRSHAVQNVYKEVLILKELDKWNRLNIGLTAVVPRPGLVWTRVDVGGRERVAAREPGVLALGALGVVAALEYCKL